MTCLTLDNEALGLGLMVVSLLAYAVGWWALLKSEAMRCAERERERLEKKWLP